MKRRFNNNHIRSILFFCLITIMFLILYNKFVFQDYVYVYSIPGDWAIDTMDSYYPSINYISRLIHEGGFNLLNLESGLGSNMLYILCSFGNPIDLIASLFPSDYLHLGILFSTYLKLIIISVFGLKYFSLIHKDYHSALISTLSWTFCSYVLIWGQHYAFCTQMMNFTIFLFLIQRWLIGDRKSYYILIPFMSVFLVNSFYLFYMSGLFSAFYVVFHGLYKRQSLRYILKSLLILFLGAILAIGIGAFLFLPLLDLLMNSPRGGTLFNINSILDLFKPYELKYFSTYLARFLSPNLIGDGYLVSWTGALNYYEAAFLSSSILAVFSITYEVLYSKYKKYARGIIVIFCFLLSFPIFTYLFTFNAQAQRWTYIIIFINCISIGNIVWILKNENSQVIKKVTIYGCCVISTIVLILIIVEKCSLINIHYRVLGILMIFIIIYCFIMNYRFKNKLRRIHFLIITVIIELIVINYTPINKRGVEKFTVFNARYQDGTMEAVKYIKGIDDSLYRISKTYTSVFLNDSLMQNYNGFNSYSSITSNELWDTANYYGGIYSGHTNYVQFKDLFFQNILGAKYRLSKQEIPNLELFQKVNDVYIYKNEYEIPFGFLYEKQYDNDYFNSLSEADRIIALTQGFVTDNDIMTSKVEAEIERKITDLKGYIINYINCEGDLYVSEEIKTTTPDAQIILDFKEGMNLISEEIQRIEIELSVERDSVFQIFFDSGKGFNEGESIQMSLNHGSNYLQIPITNYSKLKKVRIDPVNDIQNVKITSINLIIDNKDILNKNIMKLKTNGIINTNFENSTFSGEITNNSDKPQMLMIPITYDKCWKAKLNESEVDVLNINHGFIGLIIPSGSYNINLKYNLSFCKLGCVLSIISLLILIIMICLGRSHFYKSLS